MFHKDLENATGIVLVAVATGKVTTRIKDLAHEIIAYQDHTRWACNASKAIECLIASIELDEKALRDLGKSSKSKAVKG